MIGKTQSEEAHLYQLATIDWDDVIELQTHGAGHNDANLSQAIGVGHQQLFTEQHRKPGWKIVVLRYYSEQEQESRNQRVDILFFAHHAIADGTGCAAFHKTLSEYLLHQTSHSITETQSVWPYIVPDAIPTPSVVEDIFPLTSVSPLQLTTGCDTYYKPWTSVPPFLASIDSYRSRTKIFSIPFSKVSTILAYCRTRNITFTGLLHAFLLVYLTKKIPSARTFRGSTPLSMRRFTGTSNDEIVDQVSFIDHDWSPDLVSSFRASEEGSDLENEVFLAIASRFHNEVKEEILAIPETGGYGLRFVAGIEDLDKFCRSAVRETKRSVTYEISNVGLVELPKAESEKGKVLLERLIFSQCGSVTGAAFGCSVISVARGPLTLCLHWQEHAVDEQLMEEAHKYLIRRLLALI